MEWFDYESVNDLNNRPSSKSVDSDPDEKSAVNSIYSDDDDNDGDGDGDFDGDFDLYSSASEDKEEEDQPLNATTKEGTRKDGDGLGDGVGVVDQKHNHTTALDGIFQSLAIDIDTDSHSNSHSQSHSSTTKDKFFDEQATQATDRSGKSQKSAKSGGSLSHASGGSASGTSHSHHTSMSLTEQLAKISDGDDNDDQAGDEKSVSASSWFTWGRSKGGGSQNTMEGEGSGSGKDDARGHGHGRGHGHEESESSVEQEIRSEAGTHTRDQNAQAEEESIAFALGAVINKSNDDLDLDDPLDKSHSSQYCELMDLDARNELSEVHPNQALFDIIEQGFDSTDSFRVRGLGHNNKSSRALKATEVKLCFAAYVFVFTPPKPVEFALYYNHDMDKGLREEYLHAAQRKKEGGKKRWFKWAGDGAPNASTGSSTRNLPRLDSEKYAYEVVPSSIVFSLWEEVLRQVGIRLSTLGSEARFETLNYVKETLVSVGLIDCNMIDFSDDADADAGIISDKSQLRVPQECEFIAARQAINGQYGHYLRRSYIKIKECLEGNEKSIFDAASKISNEEDISMRDYCSGMLPYTWLKAQKFAEAETKLCEESFVQKRLDYFGLLEGTTIQVTDFELMVDQMQAHPRKDDGDGPNVEVLMKKAYGIVKSYIDQNVTSRGEDFNIDCYVCEEAGKALHLMAVSFMAQGLDDEGLKYLTEALRLKELYRSPLDIEIGSITLSDTHHCIGLAHRALGDFDKSLSTFKQALTIRSKLLEGSDNLRIAESCQKMGSVLCEVGEIGDARKLLEKALSIRKNNGGGEYKEGIAETEEWIGNVLREEGKLDEAVEYFNSALASKKEIFGSEHEEVGNTMFILAITLDGVKAFDLSIKYFKEALRIRNTVYGRGLVVADTYLCIGNTYLELGKHIDAFDNFKESILIREELLEEHEAVTTETNFISEAREPDENAVHQYSKLIECFEAFFPLYKRLHNEPKVAVGYLQKMGEAYFKIQDYDRAMGRFQAALDVGPDCDTVELQQKIGQLYILKGEYSEAQAVLIQCLTIEKAKHGEDSPILFTTIYYLAIALHNMKKHKHSLAIISKGAELLHDADDTDQRSKRVNAHFWIGKEYFALNNYADAVDSFLRVLAWYKEFNDIADTGVIIKTLHSLGDAHLAQGRLDMALKSFNGEIQLFETGDSIVKKVSYAEAYCSAGCVYTKMDAYDKAKSCYEKALTTLPKGCNKEVASILFALGEINMKEGSHHEAKEILTGAFNMYKESVGANHASTISSALTLAKLHDEMKAFETAMTYYRICLSAQELKYGKSNEKVGTILFFMGKNSFSQSQIGDALSFLERALSIRKEKFHATHADNAPNFYELAKCYVADGMADKAALCYKEAHRIWKANDNATDAAIASFELAALYEEQEQHSLAAKSYHECLELFSSSNDLIPCINYRLGTLHSILKNTREAITHYSNFVGSLRSDGSRDETYLISLRSLAQLFAKDGEYEKSFSIYDELIEFMEITDDPDQDALASIYHEEGSVHFELSNLDDALTSLQTSMKIRKSMGNDEINHDEIGKLLLDLTKVFEVKEDFIAASNSLLEALFIFKLKRDDANRITALIELASLYEKMDKMDEAKECYEDCIKIQKASTPNAKSTVAKTMFSFGFLLVKMDDEDRALTLFQQALKIQKKLPGSHDHLPTLLKIGEIYMQKCLYKEALDTLIKTVTLWPDALAEEAADCNRNIGVIYIAKEDFQRSIPHLRDAVDLYDKSGIDDERRSSSLHLYGKSLCMISDFSLARQKVLEALAMRKVTPGPGSIEYAQSLTCLGEVEFGEEKLDEALANLRMALDIYGAFDDKVAWESLRIQALIGRIYYLKKNFNNAHRAIEACLLRIDEQFSEESEMKSNLLLLRGKILAAQKNLAGAYDQFKRCLSIRKRDGKEKRSVLEVLLEIACVLFEQEQHKHCIVYFQEALRIKKLLGETGTVASIQNQLGMSYLNLGKFDEGMRTFQEIRSQHSNSFQNVDHRQSELAHLAYNIGRAHVGLKEKDMGLASYLDAIASFALLHNSVPRDSTVLASAMYNAGIILAEKDEERERAAKLLQNALALRREHLDRFSTDIADTLYKLAKMQSPECEGQETRQMFTEAEGIYNRQERHKDKAACLSELGHLTLGTNMDKSLSYYKKAWAIYRAHDLERHGEAANILYGIGFIHNQKLEFKQSADLLKECLKIRIREEGKNSLDVGKTCEQLGSCLLSLGQHEDALKLYVTSLEIYKDIYGESAVPCARVMLDIATLYSYKHQFDLVLVQLMACLEFMENHHGKESEEVATVLLRIGQVHDMRVDNEEAMKCVSRALEIRIKLYTKEDIRVAETYLICGKVLEDWGDIDEAMGCFQNALMIFQLKKGVEDKQVATIHDQIAGIYVERGDYDAAINSYNEALSIYQVQLGERSSEVGHTLRNLGAIFDSKKDLETSYKYYMDALKILRQSLGDNDLSVGLVLNNIGIILARQKKYRKAIDLCTVALRIRRLQLPKNHFEIADTLTNLANIMDDCNKDEQALKFYREALSIYRANSGDETEDIANALRSIGYINIRQGDIVEAIAHLSESLRIFRMKQGLDSLDVSAVLYHLGRIYGKKAEYEKSLSCFNESLRIRRVSLPSNHRDVVDTERFIEAIKRKVDSLNN